MAHRDYQDPEGPLEADLGQPYLAGGSGEALTTTMKGRQVRCSVYIYTHIFTCIHIYIYAHIYVLYTDIYIYIDTYIYIYMYTYIYIYT